jgi:hypothetical protein
MTPSEVIRQLEALDLDLGFRDVDLARVHAIRQAIAMLEERQRYDWLSADKARAEVKDIALRLDALGKLLGNFSETLDRIAASTPKGYQRDAVEQVRGSLADAFDSILHPSFYRKMNS